MCLMSVREQSLQRGGVAGKRLVVDIPIGRPFILILLGLFIHAPMLQILDLIGVHVNIHPFIACPRSGAYRIHDAFGLSMGTI